MSRDLENEPQERLRGPGHAIQRGAVFVHPAPPPIMPASGPIDMQARLQGPGKPITRGPTFAFPSGPPKPEPRDHIHEEIIAQLAKRHD